MRLGEGKHRCVPREVYNFDERSLLDADAVRATGALPTAGASCPMTGESYFLYHSIGQYPAKARDLAAAMADFALCWGTADDGQWGHVLPLRQRFIDRWAAILNAAPGSVTTFENVTQAFHALLISLPPAECCACCKAMLARARRWLP